MARLAFEKSLPDAVLRADNLPSLPAVAMEVLRLSQDEEVTIADLASCISRDPSLSAKLLRLANSSLFGFGKEISTLQRATMVLGLKTVKLMSLSFSLVSALPRRGSEAGFDFGEYWRRSLVDAVAARSLGKLVKSPAGDEAFLCGLLAHFGKLVLARCLPEEYGELTAACGPWPTAEQEERRLGFNGRDVAATLLKSWDLPPVVYLAVGYTGRSYELPPDVHPSIRDLVQLLEVAAHVETLLCTSEKGRALGELHAVAGQRYGLTANELDAFLVGLESGINETAELLAIQLPPGTSHETILDQARTQIVTVSLGTALDLHQERRRNEELATRNKELADRAASDKLTGLANRAAFDEFLEHCVRERLRARQPRALGVLLFDVDRFKRFNDEHGHQAGDEVLRAIGRVVRQMTRKGDLAARYGGEEFAMVVPQTQPFGLKTIAERLRAAIESEIVRIDGRELRVTASFGGACLAACQSQGDGAALLKLADHHLYKAKEAGRNQSEIWSRLDLPGRG